MACYHPLKAFQIGYHESGKPKYKICSYSTDYVYRSGDCWYTAVGECPRYHPDYVSNYIEIPCGKCLDCRLSYSRDWANRCMLELGYHEDAYFVTLTYDDEHLLESCRRYYGDLVTGEAHESFSLVKRDLQLFFKRLRKAYPDCHIRYYAAGEYGDSSLRPHYHAIIYGLHLDDLRQYKKNFQGNYLYNSAKLSSVWQKGFVVIGEVTWESCAYVARYIMKKQKGQGASVYEQFNIEPEFVVMSRKPGIAYQYFLDNKENIFHNQIINLSTEKGGKKFRPPKYYDRLFDYEYPDEMKQIKEFRRHVCEQNKENLLRQINIDYEEYLNIKERNHIARTKILERRCL